MRQALRVLLGRALLAAVLCLSPGSASAVDEARLLGAHHDNWLTYGHGYANQRYSGLSQIDTTNVRRPPPV